MSHKLFELDVRLREIEPPIWRTVELPGSATLAEVHFAIQVAMGWTNSHLHQFVIDETSYGMVDVDEEMELEDERKHRLQDVTKEGDSFTYEYDFGDGWEHDVTVKRVTAASKPPRPRCTDGARACPPEDCGGPSGYDGLLAALSDPKHEEHEESVQWAGNFKPELFTIPTAGRELRREMDELQKLAEEDDVDDMEENDPSLGVPRQLVEVVLALDPMQRASLGAVIAGSLANELIELRAATGSLLDSLKKSSKPVRRGRRRGRS